MHMKLGFPIEKIYEWGGCKNAFVNKFLRIFCFVCLFGDASAAQVLYLEEKLCTSQKINIVLKPWHLIQGIPDTPEPEPPTGAPVAPEQTTQQTSPASNPPATGGGSLSMPAAGQTGGLY